MLVLSRPRFLLVISLAVLLLGMLTISSSAHADDLQPVTGQISLYVNGALQTSTECPSAWKATGHTEIGRGLFGGNPTDFVHGLLSDVRVYDRELTAAQVQKLYRQGPQSNGQFDHTQGGAANAPSQWQLQGGAQWLSGQSGSLNLNGSSASVDVGLGVLNTTYSYTISAWVLLNSTEGYQTFVSQDGKSISGFYLQKRGDDNKFALAIRGADDQNAPLVMAESSFAPEVSVLYHVVGVFRAGTVAPTPQASAAPSVTAALPWDADHQGRFLESLARDRQGRTWVATEGQGVWRFDPTFPAGQQWTQFTTKDGLGNDDVYALLVDSHDRLWAGTLHGVSVYDGKLWKSYGTLEGVGGFRVFALASCPTTGDVWIATEGGLTRYLAKSDRWQQYSRLDGLPSDAIQCLAFSKTGDLYVGTQADGIAMASAGNDYHTWQVVRGPVSLPGTAGGGGLSTSLINCLYVAHDGTVYAGTTAGLARSSDGGKTWRFLRGADWLEKRDGQHPQSWLDAGLVEQADVRAIEVLPQNGSPIRIAAGGSGEGDWKADYGFTGGQSFHVSDPLDSSAVLNPAPQSVYQSARFGSFAYTIPDLKPGVLCRVRLHLAEVAFDTPGMRVFNVAVNGKRVLTHEDIRAEAGAKNKVIVKEFSASADAQGQLIVSFRGSQPLPSLDKHSPYELSEDYVTALAEDGAGHLLVGHWQKGVEILDTATGKHVAARADASPPADFVTALLPGPDGTLLIGGYGAGLSRMPIIGTTSDGVFAQAADVPAAFPTPAAPPTLTELSSMLMQVKSLHGEMPVGSAAYLNEDWQTQGDWVGRYGRQYALLCAMQSPWGDHLPIGCPQYSVRASIGPHHTLSDSLRSYIQWVHTDNPKSLYDPQIGYRRQAEHDDHGEVYSQSLEGPDIWYALTLPAGSHRVSLYFMNKDGHDGANRNRDYLVQVKPYRDSVAEADTSPELAHARVRNFWDGVYKRFILRGPGKFYIKIAKNNSRNTIVSAVMIDKMEGTIAEEEDMQTVWLGKVRYDPPDPGPQPFTPTLTAARTLWNAMDAMYNQPIGLAAETRYRLSAYRSIMQDHNAQKLLDNWRWSLNLWSAADRTEFNEAMTKAHLSLLETHPQLRTLNN